MFKLQTMRTVWIALGIVAVSGYAQNGKVDHGKYLTEEVAHCQVCHTRRLASGEFDRTAWLKGGFVEASGAGESGKTWRESGMARCLETGKDPARVGFRRSCAGLSIAP